MNIKAKNILGASCIAALMSFSTAQAAQIEGSISLSNCTLSNGNAPAFGGKMVVGVDRNLYITSPTDAAVFRLNQNGDCDLYANLSNPIPAFTVGVATDGLGNVYVTNAAPGVVKVYKIEPEGDLPRATNEILVAADLAGSNGLPTLITSISHDARGSLFLSDETGGRILKIDDTNNQLPDNSYTFETWSDDELLKGVSFPSVALLGENCTSGTIDPTITNVFGLPFGVIDTQMDRKGEYLYFVNHERNMLGRIPVAEDGSAMNAESLVTVPGMAIEGMLLDERRKDIFLAAIFKNPTNLNTWEVGHSVYQVNINNIKSDLGGLQAQLVSNDEALGSSSGIVSGFKFGTDGTNTNKIYVMDSAFGGFPGWTFGAYVAGQTTDLCAATGAPASYAPPKITIIDLQD